MRTKGPVLCRKHNPQYVFETAVDGDSQFGDDGRDSSEDAVVLDAIAEIAKFAAATGLI